MIQTGGGTARCRLYLVTPPALEPASFRNILAAALDAGDVACVQLRLKDVSDDAIRRSCDALRPITQARGVAFLLNDRPVKLRAVLAATLSPSWGLYSGYELCEHVARPAPRSTSTTRSTSSAPATGQRPRWRAAASPRTSGDSTPSAATTPP